MEMEMGTQGENSDESVIETDPQDLKELSFWRACFGRRLDTIIKLSKEGIFNANWTHPSNYAPTGFWVASECGRHEIVEYLLKSNFVSDSELIREDADERTPLYMASKNNYLDVVKFLLGFSQNWNVKKKCGFEKKTAREIARRGSPVAELIGEYEIDPRKTMLKLRMELS